MKLAARDEYGILHPTIASVLMAEYVLIDDTELMLTVFAVLTLFSGLWSCSLGIVDGKI
jgi:hypothetical protein